MIAILQAVSSWAIPVLLALFLVHGWARGVRVYESFVAGAEEGFWMTVKLLPYLAAIFLALGVFRESGAMAQVTAALSPVLGPLGIPAEIVPLMLVRPLSGSGALGITAELINTHGPDSYIGRLASVMQGSTDTTFFILTCYFGSVGVRRGRHAAAAGLIGDAAGFAAALWATSLFFGS